MNDAQHTSTLSNVIGRRKGPYLSYNEVSRAQIWQWCSAMGDNNPLYLDEAYQRSVGIDKAVAPPAMMQMWSMRDVNLRYAPGSTDEAPYEVMDVLSQMGFSSNVAVSYDLRFHRLLQSGDRVHHFNTIDSVSELKTTALGKGHFFVEHAEFFDQNDELFAEAFITYFQYQAADADAAGHTQINAENTDDQHTATAAPTPADSTAQATYATLDAQALHSGDALPELGIPITHKLIVAGAIASQDFIDVHHNVPAAQAAAMPDIFMNILTSCGLCGRYLTDWAGPASRIQRLKLKLMAPNTPGDTMLLQGRVSLVASAADSTQVDVEFAGKNSRGYHLTGSASLTLPH